MVVVVVDVVVVVACVGDGSTNVDGAAVGTGLKTGIGLKRGFDTVCDIRPPCVGFIVGVGVGCAMTG